MKKLFLFRKLCFLKKKFKRSRIYFGVKRLLFCLDFKRPIYNCSFKVKQILYDSVRSCFVALLCFLNGSFSFVTASKHLKLTVLYCFFFSDRSSFFQFKTLNECMIGEKIFNLETFLFRGSAIARSAGVCCLVLKKFLVGIFFNTLGFFNLFVCTVKLPSNKFVKKQGILQCLPGVVSNSRHKFSFFNKAGTAIKLGYRPKVRGVAMNPVDHPHGGNTAGGRPSVSFKAILCKGFKRNTKLKNQRVWALK